MAEIGTTLRESRMRARIDISEVEADTKIRAKYLRALENEEWDLLPGPVYVKSFLKTYGEYLGLDTRLLLDEFRRRYERPNDHETPLASASRGRSRAREREPPRRRGGVGRALLSPIAVIIVALVVIAGAFWVIGSQVGKSPSGNGITPATGNNSGHHHHHTGSGKRTGTGSGKRGKGKGHGTKGKSGTGPGTTSTPTSTTQVRLARLTLVPTTTVWICVENQAGKPLLTAGDYAPGQTIPAFKSRLLLVTLGNAGVTMTVDGRPYTPSGASPIALKVTPTGASPLSRAPTCGQ